jgi:repressor LexA
MMGHGALDMRVDTRSSTRFTGSVPLLRGTARFGHMFLMSEGPRIDLAKLRALIVANAGPGKSMTRRALSMKASGGRNPDLVRDIMRVDKRKPTLETAAGICAALGIDLSEVVKGVASNSDADEFMTVCQAVQAGVWREQVDWAPDDCYEIKVGPPIVDGERYGAIIEGRSMDRRLPPGTILECVRLIGSGLEPQPGDYVIVERKQAGLRELTCKRLALRQDGDFELVAESSLPEFAEPIVIGRPDFNAPDDGREISVVAIVVRAHLQLFNRKAA